MNKNMLSKEVAVSEKIALSTAFQAVDGVLRVISETLAKGEAVQLRGFGSFILSDVGERQVKNVRTGEPMTIPAHKTVRFRPSKEIVQPLNNQSHEK